MPTRKDKSNREKPSGRTRRIGNEGTPELLAILAWTGESSYALAASRLGPLSDLSEAECEIEMNRLWPIHRAAVLKYHINRDPDGTRPALFWKFDAPDRPPVPASDGGMEDSIRFTKERRAADLSYLKRKNLLTAAEKINLKSELDAIEEKEKRR